MNTKIKEAHQKVMEVYAVLDYAEATFMHGRDPFRTDLTDKDLCQEWWLKYASSLVKNLNHALAMTLEGDRKLTDEELEQYKNLEHWITEPYPYPEFSDTKEQANADS